jgi:hypothetical protein
VENGFIFGVDVPRCFAAAVVNRAKISAELPCAPQAEGRSPLPRGARSAAENISAAISAWTVQAGMLAFADEGSVRANLGKQEIFTPVTAHSPMTMRDLAALDEASETAA